MEEDDDTDLSYDEQFYRARRASLAFSALTVLLSLANTLDRQPQAASENAAGLPILFVNAQIDRMTLVILLMIASTFYLLAFVRAVTGTNRGNSDAVIKENLILSQVIYAASSKINETRNLLVSSNDQYKVFIEDISRQPQYNIKSHVQKLAGARHDLMLIANNNGTLSTTLHLTDIEQTSRTKYFETIKLVSEVLTNLEKELTPDIEERELRINELQDRILSIIRNAEDALSKLRLINANFDRLSNNYSDNTVNWYIWYDIYPTVLSFALAMVAAATTLSGHSLMINGPTVLYALLVAALVAAGMRFRSLSLWPDRATRD